MDRRDFLKAAAFTTAGAVVGPSALRYASSMLATPALAASGGTLFGCSAQAYVGKSREQLIVYLEDLAGTSFDTVHNRFPWHVSLVNGYSRWIVETGHTPILSWFTRSPKGSVSWRSIADGTHDARIRSEARAVAATGWQPYFCFHKEPENEPELGTAKDWRDAHDRVYELFQQEGATNVTFVACFMASTFKGGYGGAEAWLPPRYDVIGVDGYNRNIGGNWRAFDTIFSPALRVARDRSAQLYVIESGCVEGAAGRKGEWMREAAAVVDALPELIGVSYNHEAGSSGNDAGMNYRVDTSDLSIGGFRDMVQHRAFTGEVQADGSGSGTDCTALERRLAARRERARTLRARLDRQRRKTRRLRGRLERAS